MKKILRIKDGVVTYEDGSFRALNEMIQDYNRLVGKCKNMEELVYERFCIGCAREGLCHEECTWCDEVMEVLDGERSL